MLRRTSLWAGVLALFITACSPDGPVEVSAVDSFDPGLRCGRASVEGGITIPKPSPLSVEAQQALDDLRTHAEGAPFVATYDYGIFSESADELILLGERGDGSLSSARFELVDGQWGATGWGSCRWSADGFEPAKWQIAPGQVVDAKGDQIHLLAADNCGSVTESGHEVVVVADYSEETLRLEVWEALHPPAGGPRFTSGPCSLGKVADLSVNLPDPIGDREIIGAYPDLTGRVDG